MIGSYCELSVIVIDLGRESVVCLDNHTQWLDRLYVLNFVLCLLPFLDWEFSLLFFFFLCLLPFLDWEFSFSLCFLARARIDILTLGQGL